MTRVAAQEAEAIHKAVSAWGAYNYTSTSPRNNVHAFRYKHYVELVEPAGRRACIKCCDNPSDCPVNKGTPYFFCIECNAITLGLRYERLSCGNTWELFQLWLNNCCARSGLNWTVHFYFSIRI